MFQNCAEKRKYKKALNEWINERYDLFNIKSHISFLDYCDKIAALEHTAFELKRTAVLRWRIAYNLKCEYQAFLFITPG